jgi:hypothetical protein
LRGEIELGDGVRRRGNLRLRRHVFWRVQYTSIGFGFGRGSYSVG